MKTIAIACETLQNEVNHLFCAAEKRMDIVWMDKSLHDEPKKLKNVLQKEIIRQEQNGYERIILLYGFCGNAIEGLHTFSAELILPCVDDCISLICGSVKKRMDYLEQYCPLFLTEGWLSQITRMEQDYRQCVKDYGQSMAKEIYNMMFANYEAMLIIDTGSDDLKKITDSVLPFSNQMGFPVKQAKGTLSYLSRLLFGPWEDEQRFLRFKPGQKILLSDMELPNV